MSSSEYVPIYFSITNSSDWVRPVLYIRWNTLHGRSASSAAKDDSDGFLLHHRFIIQGHLVDRVLFLLLRLSLGLHFGMIIIESWTRVEDQECFPCFTEMHLRTTENDLRRRRTTNSLWEQHRNERKKRKTLWNNNDGTDSNKSIKIVSMELY